MIAHVCEVRFDGIPVGVISQGPDQAYATFQYFPDWVDQGFSISPLYMPLSNQIYSFPALPVDTFKGLPGVFADSLPDDFGNAVINAWLARQGLSKEDFGPLDRLLYIGPRGMGALEYETALDLGNDAHEDLNVAGLVELAQGVVNDRMEVSEDLKKDDAMLRLFQVSSSAGGARAKAVIAMNEDRSHVISGQINVPEGYEHYLIKFDGVSSDQTGAETFGDPKGYGLMEYAYHRMALDCDIDMSTCEILEENGRHHFITQRFDRAGNQKYHTQTLCGLAHASFRSPGNYSYEELLGVARQLGLPYEDQEQIFRRMVFNVIARNHDDHTKNTAFYVNDDYEWCLTPAYDVAYSYKPGSRWVDQHYMTLNGKRDNFERKDLLQVAKNITAMTQAEANAIIEQVQSVVSDWPTYSQHAGVFKELAETIRKHHRLTI